MNYSPSSYFFVDNTKLSDANIANWDTDAFGPQNVAESETYRTTSFVRSSELTKVFAVCNGQVLIQPQAEDNTKVNLILKPDASESFYPLKIKYFIYRGVNKADLINGDNLQPKNEADPNQPTFLVNLWNEFIVFNQPFLDQGIITEPLDTFPAFLIGYTEDEGTTSIEKYIRRTDSIEFYQLPYCKKGEHLGFFTGKIGLDIVLDYGDYELTNQDELFRLDLNFARKAEHVFDITTISDTTPTKVKRYKEYIHQFLDAAAFWGSHIDCGEIKGTESSEKLTTNSDIYTYILKKYQTKNKLYFYIQTERARSYNFYDSTRKIYGIDTSPISNETNGWPIIIKEKTFSSSNHSLKIGLDYYISRNIDPLNRNVSLAVMASNHDLSVYPKTERKEGVFGYIGKAFAYDPTKLFKDKTYVKFDTQPSPPDGLELKENNNFILGIPTTREEKSITIRAYKTLSEIEATKNITISINPIIETSSINFALNETKSCANFVFIFADIYQEYYPNEYYNNLWFVNLGSTFKIPDNEQNLIHWLNFDKNQVKNLDVIQKGEATFVQQKIVFDNGINQETVGPNLPTKKRRTYIAGIKNNSMLNTRLFTSGYEKNIIDSRVYSYRLFNDTSFIFYKGRFNDNSQIIETLTLFNNNDYTKKFNYLLLGITEEEYNKLIYDNPNPTIEPPSTEPIQILPKDAANVFFYLEEDYLFITQNVKRFKLGLQYEDNAGVLQTLYPSENNSIYVYTIDGYFFCSNEYSDYQQFYKELPKAKAEFRVTQPFKGEFGFDWMRVGDTGAPGDINYTDLVGKLYYDEDYARIIVESNEHDGYFQSDELLYRKLELEYTPFPIQYTNDNKIQKYYVPILSIYPPYVPSTPPVLDLDKQPIFYNEENEYTYDLNLNRIAKLTLKIEVSIEPIEIYYDYDPTKLKVTSPLIPKAVTTDTPNNIDITVECISDFGTEQQIKVRAFYNDNSNISDTMGEIIGILKIKPNTQFLRKAKKILLVNVNTNINGLTPPPELPRSIKEQAKLLVKYLRQTLTTPIFSREEIDLVVYPDSVFDDNFINSDTSEDYFLISKNETSGLYMLDYLYNKLITTGPSPIGETKYAQHFKIFIFNDTGDDVGGYAQPWNGLAAIFPNSPISTIIHELLHLAYVQHTFANYEGSKFAEYTYAPLMTDNVMDYGAISTISIYNWQSRIARIKFVQEP